MEAGIFTGRQASGKSISYKEGFNRIHSVRIKKNGGFAVKNSSDGKDLELMHINVL